MVLRKFQQAHLLCIRVLNENKGCCRVNHWESVFRRPSFLAVTPASPANCCILAGSCVILAV